MEGASIATSTALFAVVAAVILGLLVAWVAFVIWRARYTVAIRQDAVQRSQAVTVGKVHEQLLPYLPEFHYNPKDVRFLGTPVDLVVFDGLSDGDLRRIVFLEVKTGQATLSGRERQVRAIVEARAVEWGEIRAARGST